jgi:predicted permease
LFGRNLLGEIDAELAFHVEERTRELVERGVDAVEARERALARFGDVAETRAELEAIAKRRERRMARAEWREELGQDLRFATRTLVRNPVFSVVALATLVLGIGANSAIFSVVNGVLLRPMPFPEPERVVHLGWDWGSGDPQGYLSAYKVEYFREQAKSFVGLATYRGYSAGLGRGADERVVRGVRASVDFLDVVGYPLVAGRWFTESEDRPGGPAVVVLGHGLWQTRFGGDPGVVGSTVAVDGGLRTVIGVLPPEFRFPQLAGWGDLIVPFQLEADPRDEGHNYPAIARLAPGVDRDRADAELAALSERFLQDTPELAEAGRQGRMGLTSYQDIYIGSLGSVLWIMLAAVGLVLLIACANVANLLLARTTERQRELSVRAALGASRGRLVRLLLTESVALSLVAGLLALGLAAWGTQALVNAAPYELPRTGDIGLDLRVVAFTFLAAVVTAALFGLAAAVPTARGGPVAGLREGARGTDGGRRLRGLLVMTEAAVSVVLLVGAGLLISTLLELRAVDPGFETEDLLTATVPRWPERYDSPEAQAAFERRLVEGYGGWSSAGAADAAPGVEALARTQPADGVALASSMPLRRGWNMPMQLESRPEVWAGDVEWRAVSPGYFDVVGTPVIRGRSFTPFDDAGSGRVVIVNEAFVREFFPGTDPIGQRIDIGRYEDRWISPAFEGEAAEIVGVVADMRELSLRRDPKRTMLVPRRQARMPTQPVILLRGGPGAGDRLRETLRSLDPALPTPTLRTMEDVLGESLARERFNAVLMTLFAGLAVLLTAVGIFGVVSYGVRRRTKEIGIRIALGARATEVTRMVTRQGMLPVVAGIGIGVAGALLLGRFLRSMIWGVSVTDPATFVGVGALLTIVAFLASWIPARRAARADPVRALTDE